MPTYYPDNDNSVGHSLGSAKTSWNQQDILNLIDAVKTVELGQLLSETSRKSKSGRGRRVVAGNKWEQVAALLPNCWMSSSDRFHIICRGKFQELRRNYQAVLRNNTVCKFFTEEVCLKMKDYIEEVPPLHFFEGTDYFEKPKMIENGSTSPNTNPTPKIKSKRGRKKKVVEVNKSKSPKHTSSDSANRQLLRRSPRVPKRSCKLEEEEDEEVQPHKRTSPDSRTSRTRSGEGNLSNGEVKGKGGKRARFEEEEEDDEEEDQPENLDQSAKSITGIFKQNFDLLRANIDFSVEFHLHKHLHKHFNQLEERMIGLIEKVDRKIDRLDRKIESKLNSSTK